MSEENRLPSREESMTDEHLGIMEATEQALQVEKMELHDLPNGWSWTKLENVAASEKNAIVDGPFGSNLKTTDYIQDETGIPVLTTKNLTHGYGKEYLRYISREKFEELKRSEVRSRDILVAKIGSCGKTGIYPEGMPSAIIPANLLKMTIHPTNSELYVYYFLSSPIFEQELGLIITATAQPAFNVSKFRQLAIPLAPFSEQQRIVAAIELQFTRLDAAVAALKRAQIKLKRYRASVLKAAVEGELTEAWRAKYLTNGPASILLERILRERRAKWEADLRAKGKDPAKVKYVEPAEPDTENLPELPEGWRWATVEQVAHIQGGIQKQPSRIPQKNAFPYLRVANVFRGRLDLSVVEKMELFGNELDTLRLEVGDMLIVEGNGSRTEIGRCALWNGEIENCVHQNHIIRVRLRHIIPEYLDYYWNSPEGSRRVLGVAGSTSGLYTLSIGKISRLPVPLPSLIEQEQIVSEVEQRLSIITQLEATVVANLKRAERLRRSILKEAFAGRLVPQDPTDKPASVLLERIRRERNEQKNGPNIKRYSLKAAEPVKFDETETRQAALWESVGN